MVFERIYKNSDSFPWCRQVKMTLTQVCLIWIEILPGQWFQFRFILTVHTLKIHPYLSNLDQKWFRYSGVETAHVFIHCYLSVTGLL